jgi:multidrug efflux pump subunit AcrA (membrane-fusion protein)
MTLIRFRLWVARARWWVAAGLMAPVTFALTALTTGCSRPSANTEAPSAAAAGPSIPNVTIVQPERKTLQRAVRQPGYIQAFEQTSIYAKIAGYVQKWHVDIGDHVKKGAPLADLHVPELVEEHKQKEEIVKQAREALEVAKARVATAAAQVVEAQAGLQRAEANQQRWQLEYDRITKLTGTVLDKQTKDETWNQLHSAMAGRKEAEAKIESARAALKEAEAVRSKTQADIGAAEADRDRVVALLTYTKLSAPFDGVVTTRRNISTGDFVQAPSGGKGDPLYVVERRDIMRIFVEVPETDAVWVSKGSKARVRIQALEWQDFSGEVARTSYSLDRTAHTLLAEIDLPNPQDKLRPNMYAFATINAEHPNVLTLPASAVVTQGDVTQGYQSFCYLVQDGKAYRTQIQVGARAGQFVEVLKKQARPTKAGEEGTWEDFSGKETIVREQVPGLGDGQPVNVVTTKP